MPLANITPGLRRVSAINDSHSVSAMFVLEVLVHCVIERKGGNRSECLGSLSHVSLESCSAER